MSSLRAFNALIKTHHITSRKKVAKLRKAADNYNCFVLLRSGGSPGIMYCEGEKESVDQWVNTVQRLRYKDYQLVARPAPVERTVAAELQDSIRTVGCYEIETVRSFAAKMDSLGIHSWWKKAMGFISE
ncbi:hypothetical protein M501DRAFT_1009296 [Patellaria atrata CBS 101060]|uniref:Uncharacterized protein n=1 Tax=Patellaria atrata CBS 101060 TaxID=1346257 RepID=A0A9P4SFG3_9PEZI|nr:hypothetical protein M501DRAFT_1009296 [Patellaria atrata CBS 101060]